jgi:predicted CXXCH cytochrome family protein
MSLMIRTAAGLLSIFLVFTGCGFNPKDSGNGIPSVVEKGTVECLYAGCHDSTVATAGFNPDTSWAGGDHANLDNDPAFAFSEESCIGCHNPVEDGRNDAAFLFTAGSIPGLPERPIVGCEACHGAGMEHYAYSHTGPGDTAPPIVYNPPYDPSVGDTHYLPAGTTVSPTFANAYHLLSCGPCHSPRQHAGGISAGDLLTNQYPEWFRGDGPGFLSNDGHSDSLVVETIQGFMTSAVRGIPCAACHTVEGFVTYYALDDTSWASSQEIIDRLISETGGTDIADPRDFPGSAALPQVSCVTCHPSHDANNVLRLARPDLCITCHNVRGLQADVGSGQAGISGLEIPRHPQKEIFEGFKNSANDLLRGVELPGFVGLDSVHAGTDNISDACAGCHYLVVSETSIAEQPLKATTGHTFAPRLENCLVAPCHLIGDFLLSDGTGASFEDTTIASFDFGSIYYSVILNPGTDHDGDGTVEPFQDEIKGLLSELKGVLTGAGVPFDSSQGLFDLTQMASRTATERAAAYNYDFVVGDGSLGYHNPIYVVNLLAASISALP